MRFLWHWYGKDAPIVLMVHGFKSSDVECKGAFMMTGSSFEQLMRFFFTKGWTALTQEELLEKVDRREWQQKCFHLTFDDVYDTVYTEAYPVLKNMQIPFTVFVTKDLVDSPGFITSEHLWELSRDPLCRIGAHGLQHKVFRNLTAEEMRDQCIGSQAWIEQQFGVKPMAFAFPYGRVIEVSRQNRKQIRNMGFSMAFSALEGTLSATMFSGRWFLPRVNVSETFVERFTTGKRLRYKDCEGR